MLVAVYSTIGRRAVARARDLIERRGYRATNEDMRACRQELIEMAPRHAFAREIVDSLALYNMSNFRDLVFHSTEKTFKLPEVAGMLERLELEFPGFELDPAVRVEYGRRYPHDRRMTSLDNWYQFEQAFPVTFANCHPFWLRRRE